MSQLDFKAFKQAGAKVKSLVFHPVQPWLAYADVNQAITVWDWSSQQVVWEAQLSAADEGALQDAMLQRLAEKESGYYGKAGIPRPGATAKGTAPGAVKDLQFLDTEACYWQLALQNSMQYRAHSKAGIPHLGRVRGLKGHRWLIAACETKILMTDLVSRATREVPRAVLDGRAPTSLAFLYKCSPILLGYGAGDNNNQAIITPVIAVGTSAGVIYLISVSTLQVYAKLTGAHKSAVTKLLVLGGREQGGPDLLLSCSADGTIAVWEPSAAAPQGPDKEIAAKVTFKAHDGAVLAMQLFQVNQGSPDPGPLRLITSGDDKRVAVWAAWTWKEEARTRPFAKGAADSLAFSPRAGAATGAEPCIVLASGERAALWGLYPTSRQLEAKEVASLESLVPAGQKKAPKVYAVACHPLLPHLIAVGANTGVGLLSFDPHVHPPLAAFPLATPSPADLDSPRAAPSSGAASDFRGCEYAFATDSQLWHVAYRPGWSEGHSGRQLTADLKSKRSVASFGPHGRAEVALSWDGAHCSLVWPEEGEYAVYATEPLASKAPWRQLARGSGVAVAWASASSTFAVLHVPKAAAPDLTRRSKKKSKAKEEEAAAAAAAAAASAAAAANTAVKVYEVESGLVKGLCSNVIMGSDRPSSLHGGAVLGVGFDKKIRPGHRRGQAMRWYSWKTYGGIGGVMVEPHWVSWAPDASVAVLAYDDTLVFCRTQPTFSAFASLPLKEAISGSWHSHQLYVTTPSSVHCVMVAGHADAKEVHLEVVRLASHAGGAMAQAAAAGDAAAALPAETLRCAGPASCAGVREGVLWLLDSRGQPFVLPISHAGLRARSLALAGAPAAARSIAEQGLWQGNHDGLAAFLAATGPAALPDAAALSGLSLREELRLCRGAGQLRRALACLTAMAAGATERSALTALPCWRGAAESFMRPSTAGRLSPHLRPSLSPEGGQGADFLSLNSMPSPSGKSPEGEDAVDWDAAVGSAETAAGFEAGSDIRLPANTGSIPGVAEEALLLAEAAEGSKHTHKAVAAAAARIAAQHVDGLPAERLPALIARLMRAGLLQEALAAAGNAPEELLPLVAALSGPSPAIPAALEAAGLVPQAAIYTHAWRTGNMLTATTVWGDRLSAAAGHGHKVSVAPPVQ